MIAEMSGSRLGRGRAGRLAVFGGSLVVLLLLVFFYRAAMSEMAKLQDQHLQCAQQLETSAAQFQGNSRISRCSIALLIWITLIHFSGFSFIVIFEYKTRLEKALSEEKSTSAAVKQELQQRASREKTLRDKESIEAMHRYNSLQQSYKTLQTENRDMQEECDTRKKQSSADIKSLESTLQEARSQLKKAAEDKKQSMEHLKTKYVELENEKSKMEEKYNKLFESNGNTDSIVEHLRKEVFQLQRELEEAKV